MPSELSKLSEFMKADLQSMDEVSAAQAAMKYFCELQGIPELPVVDVAGKRNILLVKYKRNLYFWEKHSYDDIPPTFQDKRVKAFLTNSVLEFSRSLWGQYFGVAVKETHLLYSQYCVKSKEYLGYVLFIFSQPIPRYTFQNPAQMEIERNLSYAVTKKMKELLGRGPKNSRAIVINEQYTVFEFSEILPEGELRFAQQNEEHCNMVVTVLYYNAVEAIKLIYSQKVDHQPDFRKNFDIEKNKLMILTIW